MTDLTSFVIVKYVHLVSIFAMIGLLSCEFALVKSTMTRYELRKVARLDGFYGLAAILAVTGGLTLWFGVGKGSDFYNHPVMHIKLTLVIIVGLLSILPTLFFIKNSRGDQQEDITLPSYIRKLILSQLLLLAIVPPLATMVAYGIRI